MRKTVTLDDDIHEAALCHAGDHDAVAPLPADPGRFGRTCETDDNDTRA